MPALFVSIVVVGASILVTIALACLIHELGHAFCYVRISGRRAVVFVGQRPCLLQLRLKWIDLNFDPRVGDPRRGTNECVFDPRGLTASQLRQVVWGGPVATAMLGLAFLLLALNAMQTPTDWDFLASTTACLVSFSFVVEDLIPSRTEAGSLSDGARIKLLRAYDRDAVLVPPDASTIASWWPR